MTLTKTIGWITFLAGLGIIVLTLYSSYKIFTGKTSPPEFFKTEKKKNFPSVSSKTKLPTTPEEIQQEIGKMITEQLMEILPSDSITKLLNLMVWSILAGILIFGGSQIASLGINLLKNK